MSQNPVSREFEWATHFLRVADLFVQGDHPTCYRLIDISTAMLNEEKRAATTRVKLNHRHYNLPRQRNLWVTDTVEWRREARLA
jgi:hypothetical protein